MQSVHSKPHWQGKKLVVYADIWPTCLKMILYIWFYGLSTIVGYLMLNAVYTYISNIHGLVWFYGISTTEGFLMPNPIYIYIYIYIYQIYMICKYLLLISFLNEPKLNYLHAVKWYQILLCITNNSIKHESFVYTQLNDQTFLFLTIQLSISQQS